MNRYKHRQGTSARLQMCPSGSISGPVISIEGPGFTLGVCPILITMPLSLQSLDFAITCDGNELETYDAKQDGPNSMRAYVASEAGKVIVP